MKEIKTSILIKASPEKIWTVLMDFEQYPTWNPFIVSIAGRQGVAERLAIKIQPPSGSAMTFQPVVLTVSNNKEFRWAGKFLFKGLFDGEHYFILTDHLDGTVTLHHGEKFKGILLRFLGKILVQTQRGFDLMNQALKKKCEP
tara:strand:+ start:399 stop:827 length:429 start_codon:yes stop_codon:yes gene_type:complete